MLNGTQNETQNYFNKKLTFSAFWRIFEHIHGSKIRDTILLSSVKLGGTTQLRNYKAPEEASNFSGIYAFFVGWG